MPAPLNLVDLTFSGGLNLEDPEIKLKENEVRGASNFLFERGITIQRPGTLNFTLTGLAEAVRYGKSFDFGAALQTVINTATKVYKLDNSLSPTELTGGDALSFEAAAYGSIDVVNGVVLFGGNSGGLVRWDPAGTTRTVLSQAKYRYVTSHLSRALGAYVLGGTNSLLDPRTIAWSKAGDETVWSGFGAGYNVLAETPGEITGLANVRNIVVVARTDGLHLGHATGSSNPAFNWEGHNRNSIGCLYPATFAESDEAVYFVGRDDVHSFNLVSISDIGRQIRSELLPLLRAGTVYRGFVTRGIGSIARNHYHLVPISSPDYPHYIYDLEESSWSRHFYGRTHTAAWYMLRSSTGSGPVLLDNSIAPIGYLWSDTVGCERGAELRSRLVQVGEPDMDYQVERALLRYKSFNGEVIAAQMALRASQSSEPIESVDTRDLGGDQRWRQAWFGVRAVGQDFEVQITAPSGGRFAFDRVRLKLAEAGELRGSN